LERCGWNVYLGSKKNSDAKFIATQTFEEAEEASRHGAFVIQADCIEPAKLFNIPIFLRNCFNLACPGTRIGSPLPVLVKTEEEEEGKVVDHLMESDPPLQSVETCALCSDDGVTVPHRSSSSDLNRNLEIIV